MRGDGSAAIDDLFDDSQNDDVYASGNEADTHDTDGGWREGRAPNAFFDTQGYLARYTDVAAEGRTVHDDGSFA